MKPASNYPLLPPIPSCASSISSRPSKQTCTLQHKKDMTSTRCQAACTCKTSQPLARTLVATRRHQPAKIALMMDSVAGAVARTGASIRGAESCEHTKQPQISAARGDGARQPRASPRADGPWLQKMEPLGVPFQRDGSTGCCRLRSDPMRPAGPWNSAITALRSSAPPKVLDGSSSGIVPPPPHPLPAHLRASYQRCGGANSSSLPTQICAGPPHTPPQPAAMRACSAIPAALAVSGVLHSFTLRVITSPLRALCGDVQLYSYSPTSSCTGSTTVYSTTEGL